MSNVTAPSDDFRDKLGLVGRARAYRFRVTALPIVPGGQVGFPAPKKLISVDLIEDRDLVLRYAAGETALFAELMRRYKAPIFGYIVRCGVRHPACDDLFQDVFLNVHRAAGRYKPDYPVRPWLFTIAANAVRSHFRKSNVLRRWFSPNEVPDQPSVEPSLQLAREGDELAEFLDGRIEKLPLKQREVLVLCCIEQMSLDDTSQVLEMPLESVKTNLKRARASLAKDIERRSLASTREET